MYRCFHPCEITNYLCATANVITGLDNELIIIQLSGYYTSNDERKIDIFS